VQFYRTTLICHTDGFHAGDNKQLIGNAYEHDNNSQSAATQ